VNRQQVLVTGATGLTGSHLCKRLIADGYQVRALVRDVSRSAELGQDNVEIVVGDLRDPRSLQAAVDGIDTVYHIAALFRQENVSRKDLWDTNVDGTRNLLTASCQAGVNRFVHCSTVGVHGDVGNVPANETTPYNPGDDYQVSKVEGEKIVLQYMNEGKLPIVVFRPAGIYGPGDMRFLKLFRAIKRRRFVMLGSGDVLYQLIYISDLVDGILLCGTRESALGNVYILTGEKPVTLNQFVRLIASTLQVTPPNLRFPVMPVYVAGFICEITFKPLGIQPPLYRRRVDFFKKNRAFSIGKAKRELEFRPKIDLGIGLRRTADWYFEHSLL
jgi:nucleoside-diphosphate-sugar epimerase